MQTEQIPLEETDCFSSFFLDYISEKPALAPFYSHTPSIAAFERVIEERNFDSKKRDVLANVLAKQYQGLPASPRVTANIESLKDPKTYTITTGHQLNIFTGPLYFIYKIVTVVNACKRLREQYPDYNFVPVYWMASEDHDFEEISYFFFEGKKFEWKTDQTGAVGRFKPNGLSEIALQLPEKAQFFKEAYSSETLADAARSYVNELFQEEGLVVLDADDSELKTIFKPVIQDDVLKHVPSQLVPKDSETLEELGYKTQVNAREINFFYLKDGLRERVENKGGQFQVLNTNHTFSVEEMKAEIEEHPERFSPNVILRPLYQEMVLPNLAYVGGPSEVVYWLQLKSVFEHFDTPFPILMPRNFATVIPEFAAKKWDKTGLSHKDLFLNAQQAFSKWVSRHSTNDLSFEKDLEKMNLVYNDLSHKVSNVDSTLQQHIEALHAIASKKIAKAEKKLVRAEKRKHEEKEAQIYDVKEVIFPNGGLQERRDNFLNFYLEDPHFIQKLLNTFDAFDYRMYLLFV